MSENENSQNRKSQDSKNNQPLSVRLLALVPPTDFSLGWTDFDSLYRHVANSPINIYQSTEAQLVERTCALIFFLIADGGAACPLPLRRIESLKIEPEEAAQGYIRWSAKNKAAQTNSKRKTVAGPRQFLYGLGRCHLLAFLRFRLEKTAAKVGDSLLPDLPAQLLKKAKSEIAWLASINTKKPTWIAIFRAWLNHNLSAVNLDIKADLFELVEDALARLYNFEPPLLLEARRGRIVIAPTPDRQFKSFLPSSGFGHYSKHKNTKTVAASENQKLVEEIEEYYTGDLDDDNPADETSTKDSPSEVSPISLRRVALDELRKFLSFVVDFDTSYPKAAEIAEQLLEQKLFSERVAEDVRYLLLWLISRLKAGNKKGNRVSTVYSYTMRLFSLFEAFPDKKFTELTLQDIAYYMQRYLPGNSANGYRNIAARFYKFLKDDLKVEVQGIDWGSPLLQSQKSFRECELVTNTQFRELLKNANQSSVLSESQMQVVLLLLRRAGLRCGELSKLKIGNFHGKKENYFLVLLSKTDAGKRLLPLHLLFDKAEMKIFLKFFNSFKNKTDTVRQSLNKPLICDRDGKALIPAQIGAEVEKILKISGLTDQTAHTLRHAFASGLMAAWWLRITSARSLAFFDDAGSWARKALSEFGRVEVEGRIIEDADDIRQLMGHADIEITFETYIHVLDLITADAVRLAENAALSFSLSINAAADLAGVTTREVRRRFPAELRLISPSNESAKIEIGSIEKWLIRRLRHCSNS